VKYEEIYLWNYVDGTEAWRGLSRYFPFYNTERRHQGLGSRNAGTSLLRVKKGGTWDMAPGQIGVINDPGA